MAAVRRHWKLILFVGAALALLSAICPLAGTALRAWASAPGEEDAPPLTPIARERIAQLRRETGLTNEMLAAAGCTGDDAERAFRAVRDWYAGNSEAVESALAASARAGNRLADANRRLNVGPAADETFRSLREARQAATAAESDLAALRAALVAACESALAESQRAVYRAARERGGLASPCQYLADLTADQAARLAVADHRRGLKLASARRSEARSAALTAYVNEVNEILSGTQETALAAVRQRIADGMAAVIQAERAVLGGPDGGTPAGQ